MNTRLSRIGCVALLSLLTLAVGGTPADDKQPPPKFEREAVVEAEPVIDDTQVIAEVDFAGRQRKVYVSKLFMTNYAGFAKDRQATAEQQAGFAKFTFYVAPALVFTEIEAKKAFDNRQKLDANRSKMELLCCDPTVSRRGA